MLLNCIVALKTRNQESIRFWELPLCLGGSNHIKQTQGDSDSVLTSRDSEVWRQGGESPETRADATISGLILAIVCPAAENQRTVLYSVKITSSAFTISRR